MIQTDQDFRQVSSLDEGLVVNQDGSLDVFFGLEAPSGMERNWIQTIPGKVRLCEAQLLWNSSIVRTVAALATDFLKTTRTAKQMGDWTRATSVGPIDYLMGKTDVLEIATHLNGDGACCEECRKRSALDHCRWPSSFNADEIIVFTLDDCSCFVSWSGS